MNHNKYRIGSVPLNLDKMGDTPSSGEISDEVLEYITLRLKWKEEYDECKREFDSRIKQLNEGTTLMGIKNEDDDARNDRKKLSFLMKYSSVGEQIRGDAVSSSSSSIVSHCSDNGITKGSIGDVQCYFGLKCQFEDPENRDMKGAIDWYTKAAEQGHLSTTLF